MGTPRTTIADITHPRYDLRYREWTKWRRVYHSGPQFIEQYLYQFSQRETQPDFELRRKITYAPSFATAAINEVKNSIYQRMMDVSRIGGSPSYKTACSGEDQGVDLLGSTMTSYLGQKVLPELLVLGRVGVYVDMPYLSGETTILDIGKKRPFIYLYETEDIRSWTYDDTNAPNEFGSLLLRDYVYAYDEDTGLPKGQTARFRHFWIENGSVWVQFYDGDGNEISAGEPFSQMLQTGPINLKIPRIPFVILELTDSLMTDLANYQIALLNLASSDLSYILRANFPFYIEQYDPRAGSPHLKPGSNNSPGQAETTGVSNTREAQVGISQGRGYPVGTEAPGFIHPSSEPVKTSMEKQDQIKNEMRLILNLAISNLQPRASSAEARGFDERSLESGLSAIGLELEHAERLIAQYWNAYEGNKVEDATIKYPEKYDLKSDADRRKDATETIALISKTPSRTYQREIAKRVATIILGNKIPHATLEKIHNEIDSSKGMDGDWQAIQADLTGGLVDPETASQLRGYDKGVVKKAEDAHAERLKRIAESQTPGKGLGATDPGARGIPDAAANPGDGGAKEKAAAKDQTRKDNPGPVDRGQDEGQRKIRRK